MVATGHEMVEKKFFKVREKSENFASSQGKFKSSKKFRKSEILKLRNFFYLHFYCFLTLKILFYILRTWILLYR